MGCIAKDNHSMTEINDNHQHVFKQEMDNNLKTVTQYDWDVYQQDINRNSLIIRPFHIRHAIVYDDELFYLQQSIQTPHIDNKSKSDIQDELNNDCVYHICSFFRGDLPM